MSVANRDYPNYPPGKSTKRKLHGGPWAGESVSFREDQTELVLRRPAEPIEWISEGCDSSFVHGEIDTVYLGRYVVRKVQQKNRVITRVEWETAEQKEALIRERLRLPGVRIY